MGLVCLVCPGVRREAQSRCGVLGKFIIQVSQNLFQHNDFILAIIQSLEIFNQEMAVEIEKFVDQIENFGELLQQIEEHSNYPGTYNITCRGVPGLGARILHSWGLQLLCLNKATDGGMTAAMGKV